MSQFVVSARKYRPSTFTEVIGQDHVAKTLENALVNDKLAHAFLFCGPRGVGKTTCARILAKVINCQNPVNGVNPCNECSSCVSFSDNASFNIIELDAASNNSVEAIRSLIEQVRFQPQQGTHKVFIIDEVHMLSTAAFNAFLKTLEEPPPYAIFILATTEKHKILPTILSRCQIFDFKRIQISHIVQQLQHICKTENRTAEPEALQMIAQKADGAMRDALSIFDKIASAAGQNISYQDVITQLNILDYDYFFKMTDYMLREDFTQVLLTLDDVMKQGFEVDLFIQGLAEHLRNLMVCRHPETLSILELSEAATKRYQDQAMICSKSFLLSALNILNQCDIHLSNASNKRLYAEIALSKICHLSRAIEVDLIPVGPSIEKKTLVQTEPSNHQSQTTVTDSHTITSPSDQRDPTVGKPIIDTVSATKDKEPTEKEIKDTRTSIPVVEQKAAPSPTPIQAIPKTKSVAADHLVIKFSSYDSIMSQVVEEQKAKQEARNMMSIEGVNEIWNKYTEDNTSPSVTVALKHTFRSLSGRTIKISVPTENAKNIILLEESLKDQLRDKLGAEDLILEVNVDKEKFPEVEDVKPKTLYNNKEKYQLMVEKNPLLEDLRTRFDLKVDN